MFAARTSRNNVTSTPPKSETPRIKLLENISTELLPSTKRYGLNALSCLNGKKFNGVILGFLLKI